MSRILLVSFAGYPYTPSSLMPDNGLASLAGCLAEAGHDVRVRDFGTVSTIARLFPASLSREVRPLAEKLFIEGRKLGPLEKLRFLRTGMKLERYQAQAIEGIAREVAGEVAAFRAHVAGFKLWNGDGFSGSVAIAHAIRDRLPDVRILAGGPQVDYFHRHVLDYTSAFDVLVRGEGEGVLPELVAALEGDKDWRSLPGLMWKEGGQVRANPPRALTDLDALPLPLYDSEVYPALSGDEKIKVGVVDESRGCPNRCAFCIHPIKSGGKWNLKSPERVIAEMGCLMEGLRTRYFIYSGSNTSARVAIEIAKEILRRGLDVRYGCFGHVRAIAKADFALLRESGCEAIFYGLESGSRRILRDAFDKPLDLAEAARVITQTKEAGICAIASLIFPAPFEDAASRADTLAFLRRVRPDSVPVTIPGVIPGTPWERNPGKYGFEMAKRRDLWEYALTYKIKLLFPPSMWKPLPYRLNGQSSRRMFRECEAFMSDIENEGIVTNISHELALMASALGVASDLKGFRDRCRAEFLAGAAEQIAKTVASINRRARPLAANGKWSAS